METKCTIFILKSRKINRNLIKIKEFLNHLLLFTHRNPLIPFSNKMNSHMKST